MSDNDNSNGDRRTVPNPERGCGHLKPGKCYLRGTVGSEDGLLPSFLETRPYVPFKEHGTKGEFSRSFVRFDGVQTQVAAEGNVFDLNPLYPGTATYDDAKDNHVARGVYADADAVPDLQWKRHADRIAHVGSQADHWGEIRSAGTVSDVSSDMLMRVGQSHYDTPSDFVTESVRLGISKAIPLSQNQDPPKVVPGQTRLWFVHPDACEGGWGVIGAAYLQEVIYTEPADGNVPAWVQDREAKGELEVVEIEDPRPSDTTTVEDFDGDPPDSPPARDDTQQDDDVISARPQARQFSLDDAIDGDPVGDGDDDEDGDDSDDGGSGDITVPDPSDDRDVTSLSALLSGTDYKALRSAASSLDGVTTSSTPSKDDVIEVLVEHADAHGVSTVVDAVWDAQAP